VTAARTIQQGMNGANMRGGGVNDVDVITYRRPGRDLVTFLKSAKSLTCPCSVIIAR
jgi:hypothetical protein